MELLKMRTTKKFYTRQEEIDHLIRQLSANDNYRLGVDKNA